MQAERIVLEPLPRERRRLERWAVRLPATLSGSILRKRRTVLVVDINVLGCRIEAAGRFNPGDRLQISIRPFGPFGAVVVWQQERVVGLRFQTTLHTGVLDTILRIDPSLRCPIERRWRSG